MNVVSMSPQTLTVTAPSLPSWFVVVMGMGIVFLGLICIVVLCTVMSKIVRKFDRNTAAAAPAAVSAPEAAQETIVNRQELVAAISAVVAEELGKDVSAIRILSLKKV